VVLEPKIGKSGISPGHGGDGGAKERLRKVARDAWKITRVVYDGRVGPDV